MSTLEVEYVPTMPLLEQNLQASSQDCYARVESIMEIHNKNLRDLIASYMLKIEEKQDALWTGLQQQASRQSQKSAVEEQRLTRIETLLMQQSQNVHSLAEEIKIIRWPPQPYAQPAPAQSGNNTGFFPAQSSNNRQTTVAYTQAPQNFNVQNWQVIDQPCTPIIDTQRKPNVPEKSEKPRDVITLDLDGAFRYGMPDSVIMAPEKILNIAKLDELLDGDGDQDPFDSDLVKTEDLQIGVDNVCTVMVKNIPCSCSKQDILDAIDSLGFGESYNFFHSPSRRGVDGNLGYAFVGFADKDVTAQFANAITGYRFQLKGRNSMKSCIVVPARIQGLKSSLEHCSKSINHRNSPTFSM